MPCDADEHRYERRRVVTVVNPTDATTFRVQLAFEGPAAPTRDTQRERGRLAKALCPPSQLRSGPLDATADRPTTLVCLLKASPPPPPRTGDDDDDDPVANWPTTFRRYVLRGGRVSARGSNERAIGFFFVDERRIDVLEYICMADEAKRMHFGRLLYWHYETWFRAQRPYTPERIYLAAVDAIDADGRRRVVEFYQGLGFTFVDALEALESRVVVPSDAVLMAKSVGPPPPTTIPVAHVQPSDLNDSGDASIIDVESIE